MDITLPFCPLGQLRSPCLWQFSPTTRLLLLQGPMKPTATNLSNWAAASLIPRSDTRKGDNKAVKMYLWPLNHFESYRISEGRAFWDFKRWYMLWTSIQYRVEFLPQPGSRGLGTKRWKTEYFHSLSPFVTSQDSSDFCFHGNFDFLSSAGLEVLAQGAAGEVVVVMLLLSRTTTNIPLNWKLRLPPRTALDFWCL